MQNSQLQLKSNNIDKQYPPKFPYRKLNSNVKKQNKNKEC